METKFKVGDRVQLSREGTDMRWAFPKNGGPYTVSRVSSVPDNVRGSVGHSQWVDLKDDAGGVETKISGLLVELISLDPQKKYRSRNQAWEVIEFITTKAPGDKPVVVAVKCITGKVEIWSTYPDGRSHVSENFDLVEVPPKAFDGWVNVYADGHRRIESGFTMLPETIAYPGTQVYKTRECADRASQTGNQRRRIACLHLTFHEGEGL